MAEVRWIEGAHPGLIGEIVRWHARYYVRGLGWPAVFEALCAEQLGEIATHLDGGEVQLFSAWEGDEFLASAVMDGRPGARRGSRLRFYIASDRARGKGIGTELLARCLTWAARRPDSTVWLTTVAGLDASSHLYRKTGFRLLEERLDRTWGAELVEQLWERPAGPQSPALP